MEGSMAYDKSPEVGAEKLQVVPHRNHSCDHMGDPETHPVNVAQTWDADALSIAGFPPFRRHYYMFPKTVSICHERRV